MKNIVFAKGSFVLLSVALLMFCIVGCEQITSLIPGKQTLEESQELAPLAVQGTSIAKINNQPITLEELNEEIDNYNTLIPDDKPELKITTRDQKIDYLKNELVRRSLLFQEALDRGLDKKEDVRRVLEKTRADLLVIELIKQEAEKIDVSYQEVEDYYNEFKEQLKEPEKRRIREIVLSTENEAREVLIQLLQGTDFATLAKERSKSSSSKDGGDLGFIQQGIKFVEFDGAAFGALEVGKISNIFKGPNGYYIVKLEGKLGGEQKSLSEMWDDIKRGLTFLKQQQSIEDLIGRLSRNAKIEIYEGDIQ